MPPRKNRPDPERQKQVLADAQRGLAQRQKGYREQALALFPNVCGRCGREFAGKTLRELTVHHKDHNHDNNPPDGSNWELLCLYCHDDEHQTGMYGGYQGSASPGIKRESSLGYPAFEGLKGLLKPEAGEPEEG